MRVSPHTAQALDGGLHHAAEEVTFGTGGVLGGELHVVGVPGAAAHHVQLTGKEGGEVKNTRHFFSYHLSYSRHSIEGVSTV